MRYVAALAFVLCIFFVAPSFGAEREFNSGYVGTLPPAKEDRAKTYFNQPDARALFAALESGPVADARAQQILTGTKLSDLIRLHLVRDVGGAVHLDFPYFTAGDMAAIHAVAAKYVPKLVDAYRAHAKEFDNIFARYPVVTVNKRRLAFVVLAGFSLNWDGLDLLAAKGYRKPLLVRGPGWQYGFWASEDVPSYSYSGYYWGSSTFPAGATNLTPPLDFSFSSYGDPDSDPRMNFPDLLALPPDQMTPPVRAAAERLGLHDDNELDMGLKNVIGLDRGRGIGAILFAIRNRAMTKANICAAAKVTETECDHEIELLVATRYIDPMSGGYELMAPALGDYYLLVPVFDAADKPMLDSALSLSRKTIENWLRQNYRPMRGELSGLTAMRAGVPYEALFSQIWHELFGLATRELVRQRIIEDPRAPSANRPGSIPAVWRTAIYHHDWQ